jgi:hypothetical protein
LALTSGAYASASTIVIDDTTGAKDQNNTFDINSDKGSGIVTVTVPAGKTGFFGRSSGSRIHKKRRNIDI